MPFASAGAPFPSLFSLRVNHEVSRRTGMEGLDLIARANPKGCSRFALVLAKEPHDDERRGVAGHSAWHFSMPQSNSSAQPLSGVITISVATRGGRGCSSVVPCDCDGGSRWLMATETQTGRFVGCVDRPVARFTCSRASRLST